MPDRPDLPSLELEVRGRPIPQGSMSAFAVQNKTTGKFRGVVTQGGSKSRRAALFEWRAAVRDSVFAALGLTTIEQPGYFVEVGLEVRITFRLDRPKAHFGTGRNAGKLKPDAPPFPLGAPDVDKLARAVLDALKGTAFDDDSRVVDLHPVKRYVRAGESEGATIRIRPALHTFEASVLSLVPRIATPASEFVFRDPDPSTCIEGIDLTIANVEAATAATRAAVPIDPAEKKAAAQNRIRRVIESTPIASELRVERAIVEAKKSHALERHAAPPVDESESFAMPAQIAAVQTIRSAEPMIDPDVAAALRAGENEYRTRVLGQDAIPSRFDDGAEVGVPPTHPPQVPRSPSSLFPDLQNDRHRWAREVLDPKTTNARRRELVGLLSGRVVREPDAGHFACAPDDCPPPSDHPDDLDDFGGPDL